MSGMVRRDVIKAAKEREQANAPRDDLAARIVHRLTCNRCAQGWTCGGLGEGDYAAAGEIADLLAEARAERDAEWRSRIDDITAIQCAEARAEERERVAQAIEEARNRAWQKHLREHPLADGKSCPRDYGMHDAYYRAARIARTEVGS